jgi:hypothetical protein
MDNPLDDDFPAYDLVYDAEGWNDDLSHVRVSPARYDPTGAREDLELSLCGKQPEN